MALWLQPEVTLELQWHISRTYPHLGEEILHNQCQDTLQFENTPKLRGKLLLPIHSSA